MDWTSQTHSTPIADSCSFAPFVLFRGLKLSTDFLLFPSSERFEIEYGRERANNPILLRTDFLIASASTIRLSVDRIKKPADTIRKLTDGAGAADDQKWLFSSEKSRKNRLSPIFGGFSLTDFLRKPLSPTKKAVQKFSLLKCVC
ncbi:hypothetical protein [Alloprevotella rava]|uniref:Uncharacterized protein n=1 Tax=Alloprevotella rava TaxID=671218 RepID=A0A7W5Y164_9BACT|nr:hypothetical protein [Alloprevotella rava]MBB3702265.1 hypothetical protein [Alloprevotella rava]